MVINTLAPLTPGEPLQNCDIKQSSVAAATTFSKGDLLMFDPSTDLWIKAPATTGLAGDFGVAMEDKAVTTGVEKRRVQVGGRVTVTASGTIKGGNPVAPAATGGTAGTVIEYAATAIGGTPAQADVVAARDDARRIVGWYVGKEEGSDADGIAIPDAASSDVIIIQLKGRGGQF